MLAKALSNGEFDIQPILEEMRACLPMKKGVIDVLKSAMYSFLVSKLMWTKNKQKESVGIIGISIVLCNIDSTKGVSLLSAHKWHVPML